MKSSGMCGIYQKEPEKLYDRCVKAAEDRDNDYKCGYRDGMVEALYLLGFISEDQYDAYDELIKYKG